MSEEIVITYKTETLKVEEFTEREKAIYNAGFADAKKQVKEVNYAFRMGIFVAIVLLFFILVGQALI